MNSTERKRFYDTAYTQDADTKFFCLVLFYTGCRISEARYFRPCDLEADLGCIAINSLKKRNKEHVRQVPVPTEFLEELSQHYSGQNMQDRMFPICRSTAWLSIKKVMALAQIQGDHACPKGLRHSFGVHCAFSNIAMTLCQKWMGHADIKTTAIYYQIVGKEERDMASRMWE